MNTSFSPPSITLGRPLKLLMDLVIPELFKTPYENKINGRMKEGGWGREKGVLLFLIWRITTSVWTGRTIFLILPCLMQKGVIFYRQIISWEIPSLASQWKMWNEFGILCQCFRIGRAASPLTFPIFWFCFRVLQMLYHFGLCLL